MVKQALQKRPRPDPEMVPAVALLLVAAAAAAAEWKQDRFVISMCNDPIVAPEQLAFRYREMADANFTLVSSTAWLSIGKWDDATRMAHAQTSLRARRPRKRAVVRPCTFALRMPNLRTLGACRRTCAAARRRRSPSSCE